MALTVGAVVNLDFPARDAHLLTASGQVCGWGTWSNEVVPAMLAGLVGDAEFCNAHGVGSGDAEVNACTRCRLSSLR